MKRDGGDDFVTPDVTLDHSAFRDAPRHEKKTTVGRPPIGKKAMSPAERQRRRRARLRPPFDPAAHGFALCSRLEPDECKALIVAMLAELGERSFTTKVVDDGGVFTVKVDVQVLRDAGVSRNGG